MIASMTPLRLFMDILEERGCKAEATEDGTIIFEYKRGTCVLGFRETSRNSVLVTLCRVLAKQVDPLHLTQAICAANMVNVQVSCAKITLADNNDVFAAVELLLDPPGSLRRLIGQGVHALDEATDAFNSYFNVQKATVVEEPKAAVRQDTSDDNYLNRLTTSF